MLLAAYILVVAYVASGNSWPDYGVAMQEFANREACERVAVRLRETKQIRFAECHPKS